MLLNVVAQDKGWLFADLLRHFERVASPGVSVRSTAEPIDADAWLYMRPIELGSSPDLSRTVCCLHDLFGDNPPGRFDHLPNVAGIVATHPDQLTATVEPLGIPSICRPIGPLEWFDCRHEKPSRFCVGWVGRPMVWHGQDIKRLGAFTAAIRHAAAEIGTFDVLLLGSNLGKVAGEIADTGCSVELVDRSDVDLSMYPGFYRKMSLHVVTSETEAGPCCFYEAAATGVPTISSMTGWPRELIKHGLTGYLYGHAGIIGPYIVDAYHMQDYWHRQRHEIARMMEGYTLEGWIQDCCQFVRTVTESRRAA